MGFGVLHPAGAFALAAVGVLVALYFFGRSRREALVPALFLWRAVPARTLRPRRFRPDVLFLAQLLLLLALVGGLVRPYVERAAEPGERVRLVLVLDVSASMQARERDGTRFELARRRAGALVAQLLGGDEVMLVAAAERPHVVLRWTTDHGAAQGRLEALEAADTPGDLTPAVELALGEVRARPETQVTILTDVAPGASGVSAERLAAVDWVQIGRTDDNVAIAGLTVDRAAFRPTAEASATVLVRNYAHAPKSVGLDIRVGDALWAHREVAVDPRATTPVLLEHPPASGVVTARLTNGDALPLDDAAFAWLPDDDRLDVLVVTSSDALAAGFHDLASVIDGSRVERVDPADYAPTARGPGAAIFDGIAPAAAVPALYVRPPPGHGACRSDGTADDAAIVDWDADHPALRGLETLEAVVVRRAYRLATPGRATPAVLAATERGAFPFLVLAEREGRREACLGADLDEAFDSSDGLPLMMLVLHTLRWLEEPALAAPLVVDTGVAAPAPAGIVVGESDGVHVTGDPPVVRAERVGVHRLGDRLVLANLFDDHESDIGRDGGGEWPATTKPLAVPSSGTRELGWWLYLVAGALLAIDWALWLRGVRTGET